MLIDGLCHEILVGFQLKGQGLHPERVHLKVPGWLWDFSAPLTRKLPMFLSCLENTIDGSEKVSLVSLQGNFVEFTWVVCEGACITRSVFFLRCMQRCFSIDVLSAVFSYNNNNNNNHFIYVSSVFSRAQRLY